MRLVCPLVAAGLLALAAACEGAAPPLRDPLPEGAIARLGLARMVANPDDVLAVSPDGQYVYATWTHWGDENDAPVKWFRLADGRAVLPMGNVPRGHELRHVFPDGRRLVGNRALFLLFPPPGKKGEPTLIRTGGHRVYFDSAGRRCLKEVPEGGAETSIQVAELTQGGNARWREAVRLEGAPGLISVSSRGGHAAWARYQQPATVCDLATGKTRLVGPPPPRGESWGYVAISPNGATLAVVWHNKYRLLDAATGKHIRDFQSPLWGRRAETRFTPDGKALVALSGETGWHIIPVDPRQPAADVSLPPGYRVNHFALFPDGKRIAVSEPKGLVRVHSLFTGKHLDRHSTYPAFVGCQLIGRDTALNWTEGGRVVVWDIRSGRVLRDFDLRVDGVKGPARRYQFSPDGKRVALWAKAGCTVAEVDTGKVVAQPPAGEKVEAVSFPGPRRVVGISGDREDLRYAVPLVPRGPSRPLGEYARREAHAVSPDGRFVLCAAYWRARLVEVASGKARWEKGLSRPEGERNTFAECQAFFDRAGRRAVVVRDLDTTVFDVLTGKQLVIVPARHHCFLSGSGRWIGWGGKEGVRLWDLRGAGPAAHVDIDFPRTDAVSRAFDEDATRLITGHEDGTWVVWDLRALRSRGPRPSDEQLWAALGAVEPKQALLAMEALVNEPGRAVRLLGAKLAPVPPVPAGRIAGWIRQLDSDDFDQRTQAEAELAKVARQAEGELREAMKKAPLEPRLRLRRLLLPLDAGGSRCWSGPGGRGPWCFCGSWRAAPRGRGRHGRRGRPWSAWGADQTGICCHTS